MRSYKRINKTYRSGKLRVGHPVVVKIGRFKGVVAELFKWDGMDVYFKNIFVRGVTVKTKSSNVRMLDPLLCLCSRMGVYRYRNIKIIYFKKTGFVL